MLCLSAPRILSIPLFCGVPSRKLALGCSYFVEDKSLTTAVSSSLLGLAGGVGAMSTRPSRLPRPLTPVSSRRSASPGKEIDPYGAQMPRTIGIHIDNFGPTPSTTVSVTNQRRVKSKSPTTGQGNARPVSANASSVPGGHRQAKSPTRSLTWAHDTKNPYKQPVPPPIRSHPNPKYAATRTPSQGSSISSANSSLRSGYQQRQRSISPSAAAGRNSRKLEYSDVSHTSVNSQKSANPMATPRSHNSTSFTNSVRNSLSSGSKSEPFGAPLKRTVVSAPNPSRTYYNSQQKLPNPNDRNSASKGRGTAQETRRSTSTRAAVPEDESHEVITVSSDDDDASDIIEVVPAKQKPTIAQRLIQTLTENEADSGSKAIHSHKSHRQQHSSQEMRPHRSNFTGQQIPMNPQPFFNNYFAQPPPPPLFSPRPSNLFAATPIAVPYFPPLVHPCTDTRFLSTAAPFLLASESHSSTNSQFADLMQVDEDESLENMNVREHVRAKLRKFRKWECTTLGRLHQDSRQNGMRTTDGGTKFTLLSYNLLAPTLLSQHANQLYKEVHPDCLDWQQRYDRFLLELSEFGFPDILCFQEVEAALYSQFYERPLARHGYKGVFKKRTGDKVDGCAIFWKQSVFTLISALPVEFFQPHVPLLDRDNVALLVKLQSKIGKRPKIVVGTTHLLFNPKRTDVKLAQVQVVLSELDRFAFSGFDNRGDTVYHPIILTGDFNSEPRSSNVKLVTEGELQYAKDEERLRLQIKGLDNFLPNFLGITDQCQHYRIVLERYNQWKTTHRNSFEMELRLQHALTNLYSSRFFQTDDHATLSSLSAPGAVAESQDLATELDAAALEAIYNAGSLVCTFGAGEISHKFRLCDVHQPRLDRSPEDLRDFIATTKQRDWVCVDYIFYSKLWNEEYGKRVEGNLKLLKRLGLPTKTQCRELGKLPSYAVSSDHFPLLAEFVLK